MKKHSALAACFILLFILISAAGLKAAVGTIQASQTHQSLRGFGASVAWYDNWLTQHPNKDEIYYYAFEELGLDILRIRNTYRNNPDNFAPDTEEIAANFYTYAVSTPQILMTSWSPPANLKSNGSTENGGTLIKIDDEYAYQDFANYWVDALNAYDGIGIIPDYISIQNEPSYRASWESCVLRETESATYAGYDRALEEVYNELQTLDSSPMMIGPEVLGIGYNHFQRYANRFDQDLLYGYAYHLYHGESDNVSDNHDPDLFIPNLTAIAQAYPGKPIFQTEYDRGDWFNTAWLIHNCLVYGNVSAYLYWGLIWDGSGLIALENPWNPGSWQTSQGFETGLVYYAFWQYSKFLYPGYQRVTSSTDHNDIRLASFINPAGDELVNVILNVGNEDQSLALDVQSFTVDGGEFYRTSETELGKFIDYFDGSAPIAIPARSITTLVLFGEMANVNNGIKSHPSGFKLTNFPNPFNPETQINYTVPQTGSVSLRLLDLQGREVAVLADCWHAAGHYSTSWQGLNQSGHHVGSGIYFIELKQDPYRTMHKITFLK